MVRRTCVKYSGSFAVFLYAIVACELVCADCPKKATTFIKTIGATLPPSIQRRVLIEDNPSHPITLRCIEKCFSSIECAGFILHYENSTCYWYGGDVPFTTKGRDINMNQPNVALFEKICLKEAENCGKLWAIERVPGTTLVGSGEKTLSGKLTREQCERLCLKENEFECRSAKFEIENEYDASNKQQTGICTLTSNDRHLLPNSYRVSSFYDEYLENQCAKLSEYDFCSYEEYENATLRHIDDIFSGKSKAACQNLCNNNTKYNCRGYSLLPSSIAGIYTCHLHSEDTKLHGPKILRATLFAKYFERARCLNVTVSCTNMYLIVKYVPEVEFFGKIYMQGYSENLMCYVKGLGRREIVLKIPAAASQCGITLARTKFNDRILVSGILIIQYNQFIQTQGDRLIRVGCIFGNETKVVLDAGVTISSSRPNIGSTVVNSSNIVPVVEFRVLDYHTETDATDTQIGQNLQMILELKPAQGLYDFWASHLVATTEKGDESIFLLDDRGCPTNLNIFPAFTKQRTNQTNRLVANFQAFKFSSSPVVKFTVVVQFCSDTCPVINCRARTKRVVKANSRAKKMMPEENSAKVEELALEYVMVVRNPKIETDRLIYEDRKILIAGYDLTTDEICIDYSLFISIVVTWILIQAILVVTCIVIVNRYKRHYLQELEDSADAFQRNYGFGVNNVNSRRVRWADNRSDLS